MLFFTYENLGFMNDQSNDDFLLNILGKEKYA